MSTDEILKRPYHWVIVPDDGAYMGCIGEFPGCLTCGDTPEETLARLREAAESWLLACAERGLTIPEPWSVFPP